MKIAVIPARGGSKRIPRKNIKSFLGKPIIGYSIEAAINSGLFDDVIVSTDDAEIMTVAKQFGASSPFSRSQKNASDFATLSDVVEEVKAYYMSKSISVESMCLILATAPLIQPSMIKEGFDVLKRTGADSVKPVVTFPFPVQRGLLMEGDGKVCYQFPEHATTRSQDLQEVYHDAGMFYWMKFKAGLQGSKKYGFVISREFVQDIDTHEDWSVAELKYQLMMKAGLIL